MMTKKLRYDKMLELKIDDAKKRGDRKAIFIFGLKLNDWLGYEK